MAVYDINEQNATFPVVKSIKTAPVLVAPVTGIVFTFVDMGGGAARAADVNIVNAHVIAA